MAGRPLRRRVRADEEHGTLLPRREASFRCHKRRMISAAGRRDLARKSTRTLQPCVAMLLPLFLKRCVRIRMIAMSDHYDRLETRTPTARESALFRDLRQVLTVSKPARTGAEGATQGRRRWRALLSRHDLACIPGAAPTSACRPVSRPKPPPSVAWRRRGSVRHEQGLPRHRTPWWRPEGHAKDWWGLGSRPVRRRPTQGARSSSIVLPTTLSLTAT